MKFDYVRELEERYCFVAALEFYRHVFLLLFKGQLGVYQHWLVRLALESAERAHLKHLRV